MREMWEYCGRCHSGTEIDETRCEGCGVVFLFVQQEHCAWRMIPGLLWFSKEYGTTRSVDISARFKLVTEVRKNAERLVGMNPS